MQHFPKSTQYTFKHCTKLFECFKDGRIIGQSHDFWRAYSLFVARVASFAPEREAQGRK